jgi:glycosyltransferase involved in cell wall biosynthesis
VGESIGVAERSSNRPRGHDAGADALRIALLTYRGSPRCGGQGVYVRNLSRELVAFGHQVTVFSGPPYPELDPGVRFEPVPSLELYVAPGPFKTQAWKKIRTRTDVREFWEMMSGRFPEPLTFSRRVATRLRDRLDGFDVVHDNQTLGHGIVDLLDRGIPIVETIHHPLTVDIDTALDHITDERWRASILRWYAFVDMQKDVAVRLPRVLTVSNASRGDIVEQMGVPASRLHVVPVGTDPTEWRPLPHIERVRGRILTTASADVPLKGLVHLIEALAKVRTERDDAELVVVGRPDDNGPITKTIERFALADHVRFVHDISDRRFVELYAEAELAVVPSLYEGFSLPAVEAMACGVPLVATTGGAIPEVTGPDGLAALAVPPADAGALAAAMLRLLDDSQLRARLGANGRARAIEQFTWRHCAERTVAHYRDEIAASAAAAVRPSSPARSSSWVGQPKPRRKWRSSTSNQWPGPT